MARIFGRGIKANVTCPQKSCHLPIMQQRHDGAYLLGARGEKSQSVIAFDLDFCTWDTDLLTHTPSCHKENPDLRVRLENVCTLTVKLKDVPRPAQYQLKSGRNRPNLTPRLLIHKQQNQIIPLRASAQTGEGIFLSLLKASQTTGSEPRI